MDVSRSPGADEGMVGSPAGDGYRPGFLESMLTARRHAGHKLLVPYVTGGMDDDWLLTVEALPGPGPTPSRWASRSPIP